MSDDNCASYILIHRDISLWGSCSTISNPIAWTPKTTPPKWRPFVAPGKFLWPRSIESLSIIIRNFIVCKNYCCLCRYNMDGTYDRGDKSDEAWSLNIPKLWKKSEKEQKEDFSSPNLRSILTHSSLLRSTNGGHMFLGKRCEQAIRLRDPI